MAGEKSVKLHNKSDKPDNIILKEHEIVSKCEEIQEQLPDFLKGFFRYLKGDVLSKTRFAYLGDIHFFCRYLIEETDLTEATDPADIKKAEFNKIKASDINEFLDHCREYWVKQNGQDVLYQNGSRTHGEEEIFPFCHVQTAVPGKGSWRKISPTGFDPIRVQKPANERSKRCRMTR